MMMRRERGFTIIELIVGLFMSSFIVVAVLRSFSHITAIGNDQKIRIVTRLQAESTLFAIGSEIRALGNGVPFDQPNFQIGENTLSDITRSYPLLIADCTNDLIRFRINESGRTYLLTTEFDPSAGLIVDVTETEGLDAGEVIYITNSVIAEDDGLYGVIDSVNPATKKITINTGPDFSPGAIFDKGSLLEQVSTVTYETISNGIYRDNGNGSVLLSDNSVVSVRYLDTSGVELTPPVSEADLINSLRNIEVTVAVTSDSNLSTTGAPYTVNVTQIFSLRNLNYTY